MARLSAGAEFTVAGLPSTASSQIRSLVFVYGDQLNRDSAAFDGFSPAQDAVFMAEVQEESTYAWSSKMRSSVFLSAMRHFAQALHDEGARIHYARLDNPGNTQSLIGELTRAVAALRPKRMVLIEPGEWRLRESLRSLTDAPVDCRDDRHFYCSPAEFSQHAVKRKSLRLEFFYRELRLRYGVLMDGAAPRRGRLEFRYRKPQTVSVERP
jgi:deoxyribodipyrimidine photolyase-related protein